MPGTVANRVTLLTGTQMAELTLGLFTGVVVARVLGPSAKGLVALGYTLPVMIACVGNFGIAEAAIFLSNSDESTARGLPMVLLTFSVLSGLVYAAATMAFWPVIGVTAWRGLTYPMALASALMVPSEMLRMNLGGFILGRGRIGWYCAAVLADAVVTLGATVALIAAGLGVWGAVLAQVVASWASCLPVLVGAWTIPTLRPRLIPRTAIARRLLAYGVRQWVGTLATNINLRLDYFMVNWLLGSSAVGIYSLSTRVAEIVLEAPDALRKVWFVRVAAEHHGVAPESSQDAEAAGGPDRLRTERLAKRTLRLVAWLVPLYALAGSGGIVVLYGWRYVASIPPFIALLPGVCALAVAASFSGSLAGTNRPGVVSRAAWVAVAATVVLDLTLIPAIGLIGASLASSAAYSVFLLVLWLSWRRANITVIAETSR